MDRPTNLIPCVAVVAAILVIAGVAFTPVAERESDNETPSAMIVAPAADRKAHEWRIAAKDALARDLIAGRLTLSQTAALFGWLNDLAPATPVPSYVPVAIGLEPRSYDSQELLLAQVVAWAEGCARAEQPGRARELCRQLRTQLRVAFRTGAALPTVDPEYAAGLLARTCPDRENIRTATAPLPGP